VDIAGVGNFLRDARKRIGITQGRVADHLGVTAQAVSKWERGENMPDVAFFPDLSALLQVGIDEILAAGMPTSSDAPAIIQKMVDDSSFTKILNRLKSLKQADEKDLDFFVYLSSSQKMHIIEIILKMDDYELVLDELLPYTAAAHKLTIIHHVLTTRAYDLLEQLTPHMTGDAKAATLAKLLAEHRLDIVEDIITTFNRKQRELIVDYFVGLEEHTDDIENFIPFFDKNQVKRLIERGE